jgi:hypothetical protein
MKETVLTMCPFHQNLHPYKWYNTISLDFSFPICKTIPILRQLL